MCAVSARTSARVRPVIAALTAAGMVVAAAVASTHAPQQAVPRAEPAPAVPRAGPAPAVPRAGPAPAVLWRADGRGHGRPASDGVRAYFLSSDHEVVALDARTGTLRWRQNTTEPGNETAGSAVVVADSVVVAGDYNLIAFDRETGAFRWRFVPAIGYAPGIYLGDAGDIGNLVLAGSPAGRLYAIQADSGDLLWMAGVALDGATTVFQPTTDGTVVAVGYTTFRPPQTGGVAAFDAATGHELWRATFPRPSDPWLGTGLAGGPILARDVVIAASGDGTVHGFDRRNGSVLWALPPISPMPPIIRSPLPVPPASAGADYRPLARSDKTLFVGSLKGHVIAYDLLTRARRWTYLDTTSGSVAFGLASDGRSVYVPFVSGRHVALNAATGVERWRMSDSAADFSWPATSADDRVYLAGGRGGFVALSP